ncbi:MAG: hypothetical protein CVT66_02505 [Actinobacteria bacterium HGW-Actinobacteria-6]|jgi:glycosyltransferase involved in cell wall biosynthesis|nr:MAG: hypothetical protein CVT66_02505 [Actinobacteria bacterium HGW-Actinobacteria-6]
MGDLRERHLLIVAYELPPSAGGGVQRVTKFTRYLHQEGWRVSVVCAHPIPGKPRDESLLPQVASANIVRVPARNIAIAIARVLSVFKRSPRGEGAGSSTSGAIAVGARSPLSTRIARWVSMPDETALWIGPAVRAGLAIAKESPVDVVLATAPPFSAFVAGKRIADALGVPLAADMRDSWRDNSSIVWPTAWHRSRMLRLERTVLASAALVTAASDGIAAEAAEMGARTVASIPNGFDPAEIPVWSAHDTPGLSIVFIGRLYANVSDPSTFLDALTLMRSRGTLPDGLRVKFIGANTPWSVSLAEARGLSDVVTFSDFMPYADAMAEVAAADVGLIMTAEGPGARAMYPGKLFDYIGVGVPVLMIGAADGVSADLVREAGAGVVAAYSDIEAIAAGVSELASRKSSRSLSGPTNPDVVARYNREKQVIELSRLLTDVAGVPRG